MVMTMGLKTSSSEPLIKPPIADQDNNKTTPKTKVPKIPEKRPAALRAKSVEKLTVSDIKKINGRGEFYHENLR